MVMERNVCILWKLEGDISVSEGERPSEFEWWDTTRVQRAGSQRRLARVRRAFEKKQLCACYIWSV